MSLFVFTENVLFHFINSGQKNFMMMIQKLNIYLFACIAWIMPAAPVSAQDALSDNRMEKKSPKITTRGKTSPLPVIDMHMHANRADFAGPPPIPYCIHVDEWPVPPSGDKWLETLMNDTTCKRKIMSQKTDEDVIKKTFEIMKRRNVYAVASGVLTEKLKAAEPERIIPSLIYRGKGPNPSIDSVKFLFNSGRFKIFGEIMAQYGGIAPNDPSLEPYWALIEEMNIPVGIHIGPTPIGSPYMPGWEKVRARLHSPLLLEEVLVKHPRLRIYIMHAAWPMIDELLALMWVHPQVYVDISSLITDLSRPAFSSYLKRIIEAGFGNRVMYGSDQMIWPELLDIGIQTIEKADYLTQKQKRDILYNNAARFLQLTKEEIDKHHGR
jgi:predicted TIM-barrel fold metal-dependent hydrolase